MAVPALPLDKMSVEEKLQMIEAIWENLSANPDRSNRLHSMKRSFASAKPKSHPAKQNSSIGKKRKRKSAAGRREDEVLPEAQFDLVSGFRFYELQLRGLGHYFLDSFRGHRVARRPRRNSRQRLRLSSQPEQTLPVCDILRRGESNRAHSRHPRLSKTTFLIRQRLRE
jgi:hypothetical protein